MKKFLEYLPIWIVVVLSVLVVVHFIGTAIGSNGKSLFGTTKTITGVVDAIYSGPSYDIVFSIQGNNNIYYINRGEQAGLNIDSLNSRLLGKKLDVSYVQAYAFLQTGHTGGHINRLVYDTDTLYNELKDH